MTNQNLLNFHHEIQTLLENGSVLYHLNRGRIKEFYKNNNLRIRTLQEKIKDIYKKYFVYESTDDGRKVKFEGKDKDKKPVFLNGMKEEDFQKEMNELTSKEINIHF